MDEAEICIDGRRLDFRGLIPFFGMSATLQIMKAFFRIFAGAAASHAYVRYRDFSRFLRWLAARAEIEPRSPEAEFVNALQQGVSHQISPVIVYESGEGWARRLRDLENFEITSSTTIMGRRTLHESIVSCLRKLSRTGIWPDPGNITPISRGVIIGGNIPSFGELHKVDHIEALRGVVSPQYENTDWREVIRLNESRLNSLRTVLVGEVQNALDRLATGREISENDKIPTANNPEELRKLLISCGVRRHFTSDKIRADGRAIVIKYLSNTDKNRHFFNDWRDTRLGYLVEWAGGGALALSYLEGNIRTLVAAHAIVMIDTAFNVSTCDNLARDPFVGQAQRGKIRIETVAAAKLRSRGENQEGDFAGDGEIALQRADGALSGADVIRAWQLLSARIRATAELDSRGQADFLWVAPTLDGSRLKISRLSSGTASHHWMRILNDNFLHPVIGGVPMRRLMIRPTVLQLESARGDFEQRVAGRLAQHSNAKTTMRYLSRPWFQALMAAKMRTYLGIYEAAMVSRFPGGADALGEGELHQQRLAQAVETGLGFVCAAPRNPEPATPDSSCTEIDRCANCGYRQFNPTEDSVRALILFHLSLSEAEEKFCSNNPKRWAEVWVDFKALCEVLIARLRSGRHRRLLERAEEHVAAGLKAGAIQLVQLW